MIQLDARAHTRRAWLVRERRYQTRMAERLAFHGRHYGCAVVLFVPGRGHVYAVPARARVGCVFPCLWTLGPVGVLP